MAVLNVYSGDYEIVIGSYLFQDFCLNIPAADGKYSDGIYCYTVAGGIGQVVAKTFCTGISTTTTTTTAPPTTSTTTSTTTITAPYNISQSSGVSACSFGGGWSGNVAFSGGTGTFCGGTTVTILDNLATFDSVVGTNVTFYLSDASNVRQYQRDGSNYTATQIGSCVTC